ncbi:MAG: carbon monoxide dehydrogenase subunit G [Ktedonobacteraceae bacterium]|nr:carbon monoxide dehydrogenase subunit G [Ktedonobacteraceae bacterium]
MDITGNQKIKAPRQQVFQALLDPETLRNSIPGCESAEIIDFPTGPQLKLVVSPNIPGFKGSHTVFLQTIQVVPPSRVVLAAQPTSSVGSIDATCVVDLEEDAQSTNLSYNAHAEMQGKIAAMPDMILKGAVKVALDQFFKNFEKQVDSAKV